MYRYTLCEFEYGYAGTFYQESGLNGEGLIRFVDLDGNTLNLESPYGYIVIDDNPPLPTWAQ
jgi:hypothetical protein